MVQWWDKGQVHSILRMQVVIAEERRAELAQLSWRTSRSRGHKGCLHGNDAGKKVNGRKCNLFVNTLRLNIAVVVNTSTI